MKKATVIVSILTITFFSSCKDDDSRTCLSCTNDQTPTFELCREGNGNASVNGQDTSTDYDLYLEGLVAAGTNCGG